MKKLNTISRLKNILSFVLLGSVVFLFLLFTVPAFNPQLFKGYYTLYFSGSVGEQDIVASLNADPGVDVVISASSAWVSVSNLTGIENIPVATIHARLEPDDPRLDGYMKQIGKYFRINDEKKTWNIIYIKTQQNAIYLSMVINRITKGATIDWHIYEQEFSEIVYIVSFIGTAFIVLLLLLFTRPLHRILLVAGLLPWITALVSGGITLFILFFLFALVWAVLLDEYIKYFLNRLKNRWEDPDSKKLMLSFCMYCVFLIAVIVLGILLDTAIHQIFIAMALQLLILGLYTGYKVFLYRIVYPGKNRHVLYSPVEMVKVYKPRWSLKNRHSPVFMFLFCIIALFPLILLLPGSTPKKNLPVPERVDSVPPGVSMEAARQLASMTQEDGLPNLHDFVVHRSYQERIAYGKYEYQFPVKDEEIVLATFKKTQAGPIEKSHTVVKRFDSSWFLQMIDSVHPASIEKMLIDQKAAVSVKIRQARSFEHDLQSVWTIIINWCILLCPVLYLNHRFTRIFIYGVKKDIQILLRELK
ncbi:MAG: hypothetical protein JW904_13955 [Spirochaetales bacterium]|nr:hypothetical protein [Spirochaetales bacterium]